jgi:hypothetical protein
MDIDYCDRNMHIKIHRAAIERYRTRSDSRHKKLFGWKRSVQKNAGVYRINLVVNICLISNHDCSVCAKNLIKYMLINAIHIPFLCTLFCIFIQRFPYINLKK